MANNLLTIEELQYQNIGPLDFNIDEGQCAGLTGESGCGKTLLLRSLADLDEHQGRVCINEINCNDIEAPEWRKQVALLPADSHWWFDTVGEHFLSYDKAILEKLGFNDDVMSWAVSRISSGEKQRLALARVLINKPAVLLLDEPTANLDKRNTLMFEKIIFDYLNNNLSCALWVTHDVEQLDRVSQIKYKLIEGKLVKAC
jgi:ABC-type transport system involved in cytochrome bd biosynthesis fused ATPase/permease subunit